MIRRVAFILLIVPALCLAQGIIATVAGTGQPGFSGDGGPATSAKIGGFGSSLAVATDTAGNLLIVDGANNRVRRVDGSGIINTFAGGGPGPGLGDGGPAASAQVFPQGAVADAQGNIYIVGGNLVRMVDPNGIIHAFAGNPLGFAYSGDRGPALGAGLSASSVAVDGAGNVYISDILNNRIRKIDTAGTITTVAGNGRGGFSGDGGPAASAMLSAPQGLASDSAGNLYFADGTNSRIRKIDTSGIITTVGGNGSGIGIGEGVLATSTGMTPTWIALDSAGNLFFSDTGTSRVRKIDTAGKITTVAGSLLPGFTGDGGPATSASLFNPVSVAVDRAGNLYIADSNNFRIRKVSGVAAVAPSRPSISAGGVINGASLLPGVVPNSWATVKGSGLAAVTDTWDKSIVDGKLPTTLDDVTVTIGGLPAYLYYVSPSQINLVVPDIGFGPQQVVITNPSGTSAAFTVNSSEFGPAFFPWPGNQAVATRQDFTWAVKNGTFAGVTTAPAKPGEVIILWGTGFGPTTPVAPFGVQVPADQTYATGSLPIVTLNDQSVKVFGAALAPGNAGLYQVAIQIPETLADGDYTVRATIGGVQSPAGIILSVKR